MCFLGMNIMPHTIQNNLFNLHFNILVAKMYAASQKVVFELGATVKTNAHSAAGSPFWLQ